MPISPDQMQTWLRRLLGYADDAPQMPLEKYVQAVPPLDALNVPSGTAVLIRGDVDAKPGAEIGQGDIRLRSMVQTLKHGRHLGWKQIIFGHIGRDPAASLEKVRVRLAQLLECEIEFITDWWDEETGHVPQAVTTTISNHGEGSIILLENTRKYDIERALWKAKEDDLAGLSEKLAQFASEVSTKIASHYVHEALSAGSLDSSSVVVPAGMKQVALGKYIHEELSGPMLDCRQAELVVFSGLKIDKLDDLQSIVERGNVRMVIAAGSLAMALLKASAQVDGSDYCIGVAENSDHQDKPYFIPAKRIEQAKSFIEDGRKNGVEFVLPVDFVLADGSTADQLGPADQQLDVGPKSSELFEQKVGEFIKLHEEKQSSQNKPGVAFHNGVFGKFEEPQFEAGTKKFMAQLKRMTEAGVKVYVGGGEGGKALERYGDESWVTHLFTAGGTVLNALGSQPIPYLQALYLASQK